MNRIPLNIFFFSIFFPPICYVLSLQMLETYFQKQEVQRLNRLIVQNVDALYEGRYTLKEEINRNLGAYFNKNWKSRLGIITHILVKTRNDRILYPPGFEGEAGRSSEAGDFSETNRGSPDYVEIAADNFKTLNEGLVLSVDVQIRHNTWLSNGILILYILIFFLILMGFVKREGRKSKMAEEEQRILIRELSEKLNRTESTMKEAEAKEQEYKRKINELNEEKKDLSRDLEEFMGEMEALETGLEAQTKLKEKMENDLFGLREEIGQLKKKSAKPREKKAESVSKRFRVLYKNLDLTDRAVEGFLSLSGDFQLKAEEVVHRLNQRDFTVPVKRKVFGKGGKKDILEIEFSYSGRVYIQKKQGLKIRVLSIGTKNTQEQDLAFIERFY